MVRHYCQTVRNFLNELGFLWVKRKHNADRQTESCSSWPSDHISDIKSQSDQDGQWSSQANRCCGKSTLNSVFGLDMSEKWGGVGTRFSNFKAQHMVVPGQTSSVVHFVLLIVHIKTFLTLLISCLVLLPTSAVNWLVKWWEYTGKVNLWLSVTQSALISLEDV